jgi:hypothetical protein
MDGIVWTGTCKECHFTKVAPTKPEAVFALEKHVRFTGHLAWEVLRVREPDASDQGIPWGSRDSL